MESFATPSAFKTQDDLLKRFVYYNLHPPYLTVSYRMKSLSVHYQTNSKI